MRWTGHAVRVTEMRSADISAGKPEEKSPLRVSRRGWENNTNREVACGSVNWIRLAQNTNSRRDFVNTVMKIWFNKN
jgi:hypothetical protein